MPDAKESPIDMVRRRVREHQVAAHGEVAVATVECYFRLRPQGQDIDYLYDIGPALHILQWLEEAGLRVSVNEAPGR